MVVSAPGRIQAIIMHDETKEEISVELLVRYRCDCDGTNRHSGIRGRPGLTNKPARLGRVLPRL